MFSQPSRSFSPAAHRIHRATQYVRRYLAVALTAFACCLALLMGSDARAQAITGVSASTADGYYRAGTTISVIVNFDALMDVNTSGGTPTLSLNSGGTATYTAGSGTSTLTFSYTVGEGENNARLDYGSTSALEPKGASITSGGMSAVLTLPTPGNSGSLGANKNIAIDTTAPTTTFSNLSLSADTGVSNADFITKTAAQTIKATLSAALAPDEDAYGSLDNGGTWKNLTSMVNGTTLNWVGVTLTGSHTLQLRVTDWAGNNGTAASQAYQLITIKPTTTIGQLALSADTGISNTDFVTNTAAQTIRATLSAPLAQGEIVYGSLDDGATWPDITSMVSGTTLTWTGVTLAGSSVLRLKVQDLAGNDGTMTSRAYQLITTAPTTTVSIVAFSSANPPPDQFTTSVAAQTVSGTLSASLGSNQWVYLSLDNGASWVVVPQAVNSPNWSIGGRTLLASNTLLAKVSDIAGNDSAVLSQPYVFNGAPAPGPVASVPATSPQALVLLALLVGGGAFWLRRRGVRA